jgi:hypothetical protein
MANQAMSTWGRVLSALDRAALSDDVDEAGATALAALRRKVARELGTNQAADFTRESYDALSLDLEVDRWSAVVRALGGNARARTPESRATALYDALAGLVAGDPPNPPEEAPPATQPSGTAGSDPAGAPASAGGAPPSGSEAALLAMAATLRGLAGGRAPPADLSAAGVDLDHLTTPPTDLRGPWALGPDMARVAFKWDENSWHTDLKPEAAAWVKSMIPLTQEMHDLRGLEAFTADLLPDKRARDASGLAREALLCGVRNDAFLRGLVEHLRSRGFWDDELARLMSAGLANSAQTLVRAAETLALPFWTHVWPQNNADAGWERKTRPARPAGRSRFALCGRTPEDPQIVGLPINPARPGGTRPQFFRDGGSRGPGPGQGRHTGQRGGPARGGRGGGSTAGGGGGATNGYNGNGARRPNSSNNNNNNNNSSRYNSSSNSSSNNRGSGSNGNNGGSRSAGRKRPRNQQSSN